VSLLPLVRPTQLAGIEINPYAQELAQVVVWIGFLQWKHQNGFATPRLDARYLLPLNRCFRRLVANREYR
jgi:hypothetical protein